MRAVRLLALAAISVVLADDKPLEFPRVPATPPEKAAGEFESLDGFRMELLAAEPLVTSPVCLEYDEDGNGWVCEMRDYPFTDKATDKPFADKSSDKPLGRIRRLKDANGDGVFDESVIFADELSWPTGLAFWKGGVFVAATPDVWYLKDTDGDGKADLREKWFTGFKKFNIQAVINNLRWGLDHRLYGAGGTNGGTIENLKLPGPSVPFAANDFRFDPLTGEFERISGGVRFGHAQDDWGNRFLCNIRNPVIHVALEAEYLGRNPAAAFKTALHDAAQSGDTLPVFRISPPETWRTVRASRWSFDAEGKLYPRSELVPDGYFTSASGVTIYRGSAYPQKYYGNAFLSDVAANLVHRQVLTADGVTFKAVRGDAETEFVRSPDIWFRPVNFTNAPDGTLHVVDMYRETIEHPWSIPDDIKAALDLESGRESGRLWRLAPLDFKPRPTPKLGRATAGELVAALGSPDSWWRDTAHRLIFERQDPVAVAPLREILRGDGDPVAKLHALWSLEGLNELTDENLLMALVEKSPGLREHAVRLAERRFAKSPPLIAAVIALADDREVRVRFQVALSLGNVPSEAATEAISRIARNDGGNELMRSAVLSSASERSHLILRSIVADAKEADLPPIVRALAQVLGTRAKPEELHVVAGLLEGDVPRAVKTELLCGLADGAKRSGKTAEALFSGLSGNVAAVVTELLRDSLKVALDTEAELPHREQALQLLTLGQYASVRDPLLALLNPREPSALRLAAVRILAGYSDTEVPALLLERWAVLTPPLRAEVIESLLSRPERIAFLLEAIEKKQLAPSQVPPVRQGLLMRSADAAVRDRAKALFASQQPGPRNEVLKQYLGALDLKPDPVKGRVVFEKVCATCHRLENKGYNVGPNLETVRHHPPNQLLGNILDPNREVSPNYIEYIVAMSSGKTTSGQILTETATSITLRRANDVQETILRQDIDELTSSGKSLMPEGVEKNLTLQEMADLLGYLTSRPKRSP